MTITRRTFAAAIAAAPVLRAASRSHTMYVGTYTGKDSKGIYAWRFETPTGDIEPIGLAAETTNPSFLAVDAAARHLYAANEVSSFGGERGGSVSAFSIDRGSGKLTLLNAVSSKGSGPCYVSVDPAGKNVLVANYGGGSIACLPVDPTGKLKDASSFVQHSGSSVNPKRQREPHAHCIKPAPGGKFVLAADLGMDQLLVYRFADGKLTPNDPPAAKLAPGAGPRHFAFDPKGTTVYCLNELNSTVTAFKWDAAKGALTEISTSPALPEGFSGDNSGAEIVVHPTGRWVFSSNRGHDSIAVFAADAGGRLKPAGHTKTGGQTPRNFALDPSGAFLFAANQKTNDIVVFRFDAKTGKLSETGKRIEVASPVCVRFA